MSITAATAVTVWLSFPSCCGRFTQDFKRRQLEQPLQITEHGQVLVLTRFWHRTPVMWFTFSSSATSFLVSLAVAVTLRWYKAPWEADLNLNKILMKIVTRFQNWSQIWCWEENYTSRKEWDSTMCGLSVCVGRIIIFIISWYESYCIYIYI